MLNCDASFESDLPESASLGGVFLAFSLVARCTSLSVSQETIVESSSDSTSAGLVCVMACLVLS